MMNLRTIFSATAAATLLVVGPGLALAGPSGRLSGDVTGSAKGAAQVAQGGINGDAVVESSSRFDAEFDAGDAPQAPEAPAQPEAPEAPAAPEVSAPEAPGAPEAPQAPQASAPRRPAVQAPETPSVPQPEAPRKPDTPQPGVNLPEKPKGDKPAMDKPSGDGSARAEGEFHVSGSVRGGNPPEAGSDADGRGEAEAMGKKVTTP